MSASEEAKKKIIAKRRSIDDIDDAVLTKIPKLENFEVQDEHKSSLENTTTLKSFSKKRAAATEISKSSVIPLKQIKLENNSLSDLRPSKKHVRKRTKSLFQSIVMQMEFYFSDANLLKDRFLKGLIDRSPDGFVDLLEFGKFNKLQSLHKDGISLSVLIKALRTSKFLQLNEDESKVKRITPLVEVSQEEIDSRTVYVEDLPPQANHAWVRNIFSRCGKVVYISLPVYKTTKQIKEFAFVEFETAEEAAKACQLLNNPLPSKAVERPGRFPKGNKDLNRLHKALPSEPKNTGKKKSSSESQPATKTAEIKTKEESVEKNSESGDQVSKKKKSKKKKATEDGVKATSENQTEQSQSVKKKKKKKKKKKNAEEITAEKPAEEIKSVSEEPKNVSGEHKSVSAEPKSVSEVCVEEKVNVKIEMEDEIQNLSEKTPTGFVGEKTLCKEKAVDPENVKFQEMTEKTAAGKKKDLKEPKSVDTDKTEKTAGKKKDLKEPKSVDTDKTEKTAGKKKDLKEPKSVDTDKTEKTTGGKKNDLKEPKSVDTDKTEKTAGKKKDLKEPKSVDTDKTEKTAAGKKKGLKEPKSVDTEEQKTKKKKKLDKEKKTEYVENVPVQAVPAENQELSRKERKRLRQEDIRRKKLLRSEMSTSASETLEVKPDLVNENGENSNVNSNVKEESSVSVVTANATAEETPTKVEKSEITSILKLKKGQEKKKVEFDPVAVTTEFLKGREIRKRKKPKKNQLHLRVISKRDWLSLKAEYITQQKSHVAALKESLRELRQQENQNCSGNKHVDLEDVFGTKRLKTSHEVKMAHVESLKFIPNVIVQWKCSYDVHRDKIKTMFKEISGNSIAYIDAMEEAKTGYIRFKDEASAEEFAKMSRNSNSFMARVLPMDQQQAYWTKANEDRVKKLAGKKKEKGADKIARKVFERNKATFNHKPTRIVFNEDETGESSSAVKKDNPSEPTTSES